MIPRVCQIFLLNLLMISANGVQIRRQAESGKKCYTCQDADCLTHEVKNCDKTTMSSMGQGKSAELWNLLVKEGAEFDDAANYNQCFGLIWIKGEVPPSINQTNKLWGCAPTTIGKLDYCKYVKETTWKLDYYVLSCASDVSSEKEPDLGDVKTCFTCENVDCSSRKIMNCKTEKMSSMDLYESAKNMWDLLVAGAAVLDDPAEYTHCFGVVFDHAVNGGRKQSALTGCAPEIVDKDEYCSYVKKTAVKNNFTMLRCRTRRAGILPRILVPRKKNCFMCQNSDCLKPSRILDCHEKAMDLSYLNKDALLMWNSLNTTKLITSLDKYNYCFRTMWKNGTASEPKSLWGCTPDSISINQSFFYFCQHFNETAKQFNYTVLGCDTCRTAEKPCFDSSSWTVTSADMAAHTGATTEINAATKKSSATKLYNHAVFWWMVSVILLKIFCTMRFW